MTDYSDGKWPSEYAYVIVGSAEDDSAHKVIGVFQDPEVALKQVALLPPVPGVIIAIDRYRHDPIVEPLPVADPMTGKLGPDPEPLDPVFDAILALGKARRR